VKAAEAAGQLGGTDAYWAMHAWIVDHQKEFSEETATAQAVKLGLKAEDFKAKMNSPEVEQVIQSDIELASRVHVEEIPRIHVNGRWVPRWKTPNGFVLERIIDEAHKPPPPPPVNTNPQIPQIPGVNAPIGGAPPVFNPH
jgi:protein-disulfide isomerase